MLKDKYVLVQDSCCTSPANFFIYENQEEDDNNTALSQTDMFKNKCIGRFQQNDSSCCLCCSCRPVQNLKLTMYSQNLSLTNTHPSSVCSFPGCPKQLVVMTENKVMIGKIIRKMSCLGSKYDIFYVEDHSGKLIYKVRNICCQCGNWMPTFLRCCGMWEFEIVNEKEEVVGKIQNSYNGFFKELFTFQDRFEIEMPKDANGKSKILLLNSIIYLKQFFFGLF